LKSLDVDCKVSAYCTINASEDIDKVRASLSNVLIDMDEKKKLLEKHFSKS